MKQGIKAQFFPRSTFIHGDLWNSPINIFDCRNYCNSFFKRYYWFFVFICFNYLIGTYTNNKDIASFFCPLDNIQMPYVK